MNTTPFLSNRMYDILKWVAQIALPASGTFYFALGQLWQWPSVTEVVGTITAVDVFLGALLGLANRQYKNAGLGEAPDVGVINVVDSEDKLKYDLVINMDPEKLKDMTKVAFAINKDGTSGS